MNVRRLTVSAIILTVLLFFSFREVNAADHFNCLKPTDVGISTILSTKPITGSLKDLLRICGLLKDVETVRYFTEKTFDRGTLIGLGNGCVKWIFYLNLKELKRLLKSQTCPK